MSKADSLSGMQYAPEHRCQLFDMLLKIFMERILIMEKNENKRTTTAPKKNATSGKTRIIVERTFGEGDLLELYAEYVAGKIRQRMKA